MDQWPEADRRLYDRKNRARGDVRIPDALQGSGRLLFRNGRQPSEFLRFAILGMRAPQEHYRHSRADLHVAGRSARRVAAGKNQRTVLGLCERTRASRNGTLETAVPHFLADRKELGSVASPPSLLCNDTKG